jgi:hypothetical protein
MNSWKIAAAAALVLGACAHGHVVLTHPRTGQAVECKKLPWGDGLPSTQIAQCVKAYEQSGFKITGDTR